MCILTHFQCLISLLSYLHFFFSLFISFSLESFPRGFPTGLSHVSRWCESILGMKAEAVQGKQVSVELE